DGHKPGEFVVDLQKTMTTICNNLIAAGVLLPAETERYKNQLRTYDPVQLIKVLITSHELREYSEGG
ncbi:unnamed protein product, partial [marine sediment metagenome]